MQARTSVLVLLVACGSEPAAVPDAPAPPDAPAAPTVALTATPSTITRPGTFTLAIATTNHTFVDPTAQPAPVAEPGKGHFHYYFDGDSQNYGAGWTPAIEIEATVADPPGPHSITVVLVNSEHVDLSPAATDTVEFTLQ